MVSAIQIIEATGNYLERWDVFIDSSINGTIFHKRKFLSYHGIRFYNKEKFLIVLDGNALYAQICLSLDDNGNGLCTARSPYGASYGGFIFQKQPSYHKGKEIVTSFVQYLLDNNVYECIITHPINCCSANSMDTFYFNLMEQGFTSINRDISSVVSLKTKTGEDISKTVSSRARKMARKAEANNILNKHKSSIDEFWHVMEYTFAKIGKEPTHTLNEFKMLAQMMPEDIYVDVAYYQDIPVAGIGFFVLNPQVNSSFYLCQNPQYQHLQGLSLLVLNALDRCQKEGYRYFDFGTSTNNMVAKENIFSFKENYSKVGLFRETFKWIAK